MSNANLDTVLTAISYIALVCSAAFLQWADSVVQFVTETVLLECSSEDVMEEDMTDWANVSSLCITKARASVVSVSTSNILQQEIAIKLLGHYICGLSESMDKASLRQHATPAIATLLRMLERDGYGPLLLFTSFAYMAQ